MQIRLNVTIERKHAPLPAFVVVPTSAIAAWQLTGTTTVEGTLTGPAGAVAIGRRSIKRWDDDRWFVELTAPVLAAAGLVSEDQGTLDLWLASEELPPELTARLADPALRARWEAMTAPQRRMAREALWALKSAAARDRWIDRQLAAPEPAEAPRAAGKVAVTLIGADLPGTAMAASVCLQVGTAWHGITPADAAEARWEAEIERGADGRVRGPAVHGPTGGRFFYLGWLDASGKMFRRLKLVIDDVPPEVWAAAVAAGRLIGRVSLTDGRGEPRCATAKAPALAWSAGG